ncbi:MAG: response regulator, partial [Planctomycetales bacterium]|nr:response regulator [Planctomycetales bacterium]
MIRVLVVDDSRAEQQLAGACVKKCDAEPMFASDGNQALTILATNRPDAVLTDLRMPEMDGLELVQRVRRDYADIPVILMTAFGSEDIAVQALQAGAASYVPKKSLVRELPRALRVIQSNAIVNQQRDLAKSCVQCAKWDFVLGYTQGEAEAVVTFLQDVLARLNVFDKAELWQISTALTEALSNAIDHGNLELDSELRESAGDEFRRIGIERSKALPYRDRRVYLSMSLSPDEVRYMIRDEGNGFDPTTLPDPTDPENLHKASGRG